MPVKVHLPAASPGGRSVPRLGRPGWGWAVPSTAAAAVVLLAALGFKLLAGGSSPNRPPLAGPVHQGAGSVMAAPGATPCDRPAGQPLAVGPATGGPPGAASLPAFPYRATARDSQDPRWVLELAASAIRVAPGATLRVVARLQAPSAALQAPAAAVPAPEAASGRSPILEVVPCVALRAISGHGAASGVPPPAVDRDSAAGGAEAQISNPLAVGLPAPAGPAGTLPSQALTIPADLPPGTRLEVVATAPSSLAAPAGSPLVVRLGVTVG